MEPRKVFDNPETYINLITTDNDDKFEDQFFDRKEMSSRAKTTSTQIQKTISAFGNSNKQGGLLILGVSTDGEIKGIKSFSEEIRNACTNINNLLVNHAASVKAFDCKNYKGEADQIILIFSDFVNKSICSSHDDVPKSWVRSGSQNIVMTQELLETVRRQKGITNFETSVCCQYFYDDVDLEIVARFSNDDLENESEIQERLYNLGAIIRQEDSYYFTNAGNLFFAKNPQRKLNYATIRLAKFEVDLVDWSERGLPTFEKTFEGPLSKQILKIRAYLKESGFFKNYKYRKLGGGFEEEPEYPENAIDEAIVNAVAHRDYAISIPIECIKYNDAFYVENPGIINQRTITLPKHFTLDEQTLVSTPMNSTLVDWLKQMKDDKGSSFVQKWGEGTRTIKKTFGQLNLPSPEYNTSLKATSLTLRNNFKEREAKIRQTNNLNSNSIDEYMNMFELKVFDKNNKEVRWDSLELENKLISMGLSNKLSSSSWYIDKVIHSRIKAHRKNNRLTTNITKIDSKLHIYPAFNFQLRSYFGKLYLILEYSIETKNILKLNKLNLESEVLINRHVDYLFEGDWAKGKILDIIGNTPIILNFATDENNHVSLENVIPRMSRDEVNKSIGNLAPDLEKFLKKASLLIGKNSPRERSSLVLTELLRIKSEIFPLKIRDYIFNVKSNPQSIQHNNDFELNVLAEPKVEFRNQQMSPNIREGITSLGAYEDVGKIIKLVPICLSNFTDKMKNLIFRLQTGKYKYKGAERTFNTRFQYDNIYSIANENDLINECERLLKQHPEWIGKENNERLFLVHIPDTIFSRSNVRSNYFLVKKLLLENGIPCQMVSSQTLNNPDWRDLNLALNISAKCGVTPWVLPNKIPDADFFIGFSYTQEKDYKKGGRRLIGYANVFNSYGKWEFFSGSNSYINYDNRNKYFGGLAKEILEKLDKSLPDNAIVHFHYSSRFSKDDRLSIVNESKKIRPNGTFVFTSINNSHLLKMYDNRPETNGSSARGSFIKLSMNRLLLSTTGHNTYSKTLGTPRPLEATIWEYGKSNLDPIDLKSAAVQLLSLTKLNWASTSSISSEPITTKYASNIAYLTMAFLSIDSKFELHKSLEKTPWFI